MRWRRARILVVACTAAAIAAGTASAALAPPAVSSNWAGYALTTAADPATADPTATTFNDVTGSWVEPKATCTAGTPSSSAFWVGLGGSTETSQALEQVGTEARCNSSSTVATHAAWYEVVPAPPVTIKLKVRPGDHLTAAVVVTGSRLTLQLRNTTRRWRYTKNIPVAQPDLSSAEWIAEAPSVCNSFGRCRAVPLTNFGTVSFTKAAAIASGHAGVISDPFWTTTPIQLDPSGSFGAVGSGTGATQGAAAPSPLSSDGRSFSVSWSSSSAR
jgi:hypothetical protein